MRRRWFPSPNAELLALQSAAERAGCALACNFASSAELEAALIRARLAAGAYGPKRHRRSILRAGAVIGTLIILALLS